MPAQLSPIMNFASVSVIPHAQLLDLVGPELRGLITIYNEENVTNLLRVIPNDLQTKLCSAIETMRNSSLAGKKGLPSKFQTLS
jgi:hypothetical protein